MEYELYHYGVKGMKWGVRRYQRKDGSITEDGAKRYHQVSALRFPLLKENMARKY